MISDYRFESEGRAIVSADASGAVRVWDLSVNDVADSGIALRAHYSGVSAVVFSNDGQLVIAGYEDGALRVWDLDVDRMIKRLRSAVGRELTNAERTR
jgi:WD40 repeat protein